jgi:formylglycine-generating enzyme required for sulfatase activity
MTKILQLILVLLLIAAPALHSFSAESKPPSGFVLIQGGSFTMGSPASEFLREKDETQHTVTVNDFYMARHEVTQREYRELMETSPSEFEGDDLPVENVSWFDAVAYCNARSIKEGLTPTYTVDNSIVVWNREANGYRLPTEAEWEYAARAGITTPFYFGEDISQSQANYYGNYPYRIELHYFSTNEMAVQPGGYRGQTVPVGSFAANAWELHDMHGNVSEWCWDWYGEYPTDQTTNPAGSDSGVFRVTRGGGWNDFGRHLRSAYRGPYPPENATFSIGFRLVRNAPPAAR